MQYGMELVTYRRKKKVHSKNKFENYKWYMTRAAYFGAAFLISRVLLINGAAPFGIAFLISIALNRNRDIIITAGIGSLLGYITLINNIDNLPMYILFIVTVVSGSYLIKKISKRKKLIAVFILIFIESVGYNYLVNSYSVGVNLVVTLFDVICIVPLYFIIDYAVICSKEIKSNHLFTNEEIISMAIVAALVISGSWGIYIFGISIRNVLALGFVIINAYINGCANGAAAGIAVGVILGMTTENIIMFISVYGLSGLTVGLFKETGKWLSALSFVIAFFILKIYSQIGVEFKLIEAIISAAAMLIIPGRLYKWLSLEFNWEKKAEKVNQLYTDTVKELFVDRLKSFSEVLLNMSDTVKNLVSNDKLLLKNKSSAMVENLADRVCANCNMNTMCWKREIYYTYTAFSELLKNYQEGKNVLPDELEKKCVKRTALLKNTEDIINNYIINEMCRNRLIEGRQIIAGHLNNMAETVSEIVDDLNNSIIFNNDIERLIKKLLDKKGVNYSNVFCFEDKKGRMNVRITLQACGMKDVCVNQVLPAINQVAGINMCLSEDGCKPDNNRGMCTVRFEEAPKYYISSYVARECKEGEKYNGDSYSFGKVKDGTYMIILSDGMGSGPEAGQESKAAVELIERFTEAGFSKSTAVNTVNSIMTMKFSEEEKFSTLDIASIDLYTGYMNMMKIGAVSTYIKRKEKVDIIKSRTLPIGVLDKVDIDVIDKKIYNGDLIVMLSDGVLECEGNNSRMEEWVIDYLSECSNNNGKTIADDIIAKAKEINNGKARDDMTVIVSRVYSI